MSGAAVLCCAVYVAYLLSAICVFMLCYHFNHDIITSSRHSLTDTPTHTLAHSLTLIDFVLCMHHNIYTNSGCSLARSFREVNLDIWHSAEAASAWHQNNQTHREPGSQHHGSTEMTNSLSAAGAGASASASASASTSMTASLTPTPDQPVQWHNRCGACRCLAPGHDPQQCPSCGAAIEPMPYF